MHVVIECAKLAFADRDALYGDDPDVPLDTLLSREYNDARRALVGDEASAAYEPGLGRLPHSRRRRSNWPAPASPRAATPSTSTSSTASGT